MSTAQQLFELAFPGGLERSSDESSVVYVAVPITTGLLEFLAMKELGIRSREVFQQEHSGLWREQVVEPNVRTAHAYAVQAKAVVPWGLRETEDAPLPTVDIVDPATVNLAHWTQAEYAAMWDFVIREHADYVAVAPTWAYSRGARHEVELAVRTGKPLLDLFGHPLTVYRLREEALKAHARLQREGWTDSEIAAMLPAIDLGTGGGRPLTRTQKSNRRASEIFSWIASQRYLEICRGDRDDDAQTQESGLQPGGAWCQELNELYDHGSAAGLENPSAREDLARYVLTGCALLESAVRLNGPLPSPAQSRSKDDPKGEWRWPPVEIGPSRQERLRSMSDDVVAWLSIERHYVRTKFRPEEDDEHTEWGLEGHWRNQLQWYRQNAEQEGLSTKRGRQWLAKFVATAMGCLESAVRLYGPFPSLDGLTKQVLVGDAA